MFDRINMSLWSGRTDQLEGEAGRRWHQVIKPITEMSESSSGIALLGFPCDQGVKKNEGRLGAQKGPDAIRYMLSNHAWHLDSPLFEAGDVCSADEPLDTAQDKLSDGVLSLLQSGQRPIVMGGGHEVAWGSWQGLSRFAQEQNEIPVIGIINFDAHFDLRAYDPEIGGSSGTPFKQIADQCQEQGSEFRYACFGVAQSANTPALFSRADSLQVSYRTDEQMGITLLGSARQQLTDFMQGCDWVYLTIDLDVFPAGIAPGVSAPAARGVSQEVIELLISDIQLTGKLKLADIAELNPEKDIDNHTARLAARLIGLLARN